MNIYKGRLKRWNEDKGFGFIESNSDKKDTFIHISALKRMGRRPVEGDIIEYEIHIGNDGKKRAVNAKIEGATEIKPRLKRTNTKHYKKSNNLLSKLMPIILFIIIIVIYFNNFKTQQLPTSLVDPITENSSNLNNYSNRATYSCNGKTHCSEMSSCEEATFYQNNCSGTRMDGDGDGIPCERQLCGW